VHCIKKTAQSAKDGYDIAMWQARQANLDAEEAVKSIKDLDQLSSDTKKSNGHCRNERLFDKN
jgi:hypothetical protein